MPVTTTETSTTNGQMNRVLLAQMIAVEKGAKQRTERKITDLHRQLARTPNPQMTGLSRTYRPVDEEDPERLPAEQVRVQVRGDQLLDQIAESMVDMFDIVYTREYGNTIAKADIQVGEVVIARDVPATYLLFLEKQLNDLMTIVRSLPVVSADEEWTWDPATGVFRTPARLTHRTKKIPFPFIKAPATDKHPAQVETQYEDKIVGFWEKIQYSGAFQADRVLTLQQRVEALQRAVKFARERANATEVEQQKIGKAVFDYLMAP
jgi:hypothetical protein